MNVQVEYNSIIATAAGKKAEIIRINENTSISELMEALCKKYGQSFRDIIYMNSGKRRYLVNFIVNGRLTSPDMILVEGDKISIILALGGG